MLREGRGEELTKAQREKVRRKR